MQDDTDTLKAMLASIDKSIVVASDLFAATVSERNKLLAAINAKQTAVTVTTTAKPERREMAPMLPLPPATPPRQRPEEETKPNGRALAGRNPWLSLPEAAARLHMPKKALYHHARTGVLRARREGRNWWTTAADVDDLWDRAKNQDGVHILIAATGAPRGLQGKRRPQADE